MVIVQGSFARGEIRAISPTPVPNPAAIFSRLENVYIESDATLKVRNPFRKLTTNITKTPGFFTAKIYSYATSAAAYHNRVLVVQFGDLIVGSLIARKTVYSLIDTDTEDILVLNQPFLPAASAANDIKAATNDTFFPEHFDITGLRINETDTEDKRVFYVAGCRAFIRFEITDIGIKNVIIMGADPQNPPTDTGTVISHPYAMTIFGGYIVMMCFTAKTYKAVPFADIHAFGTVVVLFNPAVSYAGTKVNFRLAVLSSERILSAGTFAESVFFITNQGLRGLFFADTSAVTAVDIVQRKISSFEGRNIVPRSLHANFLYYGGDELRVRDISSLQASIVQAGDFVANGTAEPTLPIISGSLFGEDTLLFLQEDKKTFKALFYVPLDGAQLHSMTTFFESDIEILDFFTGEAINWFYITEGETGINLTEYNTKGTTTEASIDVFLETSQFPLVSSFSKMRIAIDKGDSEFTAIPNSRYDFNKDGKAILSVTTSQGGRRFGDPMSISFSTIGSMRIVFAQLWYELFTET
jgi:hypothetical protein